MITEGSRIDFLKKEIEKLEQQYDAISHSPYANHPRTNYVLKFLRKKINKLSREKENWERLYKSIEEVTPVTTQHMDTPPAIVQQATTNINKSVASAKVIQDSYLLAATIWMEGRGEGEKGMEAIMNVILNTVGRDFNKAASEVLIPNRYSAWRGKKNPYQFSQELAKKRRELKDNSFLIALSVVELARTGQLKDTTNGATYYFNPTLANPSWAKKMKHTATIGQHVFYKPKSPVKSKITENNTRETDILNEIEGYDPLVELMGAVKRLEVNLKSEFPELDDLSIFLRSEGEELHLNSLRVNPNERQKGIGRKVMEKLIEFADKYGLYLTLHPQPEKGYKQRLLQFYKQFGFYPNKGSRGISKYGGAFGIDWIRKPKTK